MLEIVVLVLFLFGGYLITVGRNLYFNWQNKRQEAALDALASAMQGRPIVALFTRLGDPYEIEHGATSDRALYVWKFPPAKTLPPARGLVTLNVTAEHDTIAAFTWQIKR